MTSTVHIAFYCSSTSRGGLEMNTVRYAQWMQEEGFRITVYCVANTPVHQEALQSNLTIQLVERNGKYLDWLNALRIARLFSSNHVDVCWFRDTRDMDLLGWAKRFSKRHFRLLYQQAMQFGVSKKDVFHTLRFSAIDAWVSTLEFLKQQVVSSTHFPNERIHVVPLGVDASRLLMAPSSKAHARNHYHLPDDAFVFGLIGRIDPLKGQHIAVEALRILHHQGRKVHLLLVGETTRNEGNTYAQIIQEQIRNSGLENYVHLHPYTSEVALFYQAIDAFMLCSKGETFGTVTIEAMASGIPIIGTNSSGTPELLGNGEFGRLVAPDNAEALAQVMVELMADFTSAQVKGDRAKAQFARHYSKDASVQAMRKIVLSLTANHG